MSKRCKRILYAICSILLIGCTVLLIKLLFFSGLFVPRMTLHGDDMMEVEVNTEFVDPGVKTRYHFTNFDEDVVVDHNINMKKVGVYTVRYQAKRYDKLVTRRVRVVDHRAPVIQLKGDSNQRVFVNGTYREQGFQAIDNYDGDLRAHVQVQNSVNMKKVGMYTITYSVRDANGNLGKATRHVEVCEDPTSVRLHYEFDSYDNMMEEWWFRKSEDHKRTTGAKPEALLKKYDTYYQGPNRKVLYLTFDEGGNDITYIKEIAKILEDNDVVATYFLTRNYIKDNPEFMNQLVNRGNLIGNHTWHHYDMTTLANAGNVDKFVKEISETEKTYMEVTGKSMVKVFRFPKGGSSERAMKMVKALGYSTYNWSHAYYDYASDVTREEALKTMMDHYHNGAIYLLHPSNKGNYEAMDTFIKNMKQQGYTFETVERIPQEVKKNINK